MSNEEATAQALMEEVARLKDEIPTLETEDGVRFEGTKTIFASLGTLDAWKHERAHRAQYRAHAEARRNEVTGRLLEDVPLTRAR